MIIVLLPRTFIRFQSIRTGQTLLHPGVIVCGHDQSSPPFEAARVSHTARACND
jgi:hypothetical protein